MKRLFTRGAFAAFVILSGSPAEAWALKHPVLLLHGATKNGANISVGPFRFDYWGKVLPFFRQEKVETFVPSIPMTGSRHERALFIQQFIREHLGGRQFHIVAHSLTGTDARYLISMLNQPGVLSLTTIASPHRGAPMSDFFTKAFHEKNFFYWLVRALNFRLERIGYLHEVSLESMELFNQEVLDRSDVQYFSVVAIAEPYWWKMSPVLWAFRYLALHGRPGIDPGPSDGIIPVRSQSWGRVIDVVAIDHLGQLNYHWWRYPQHADVAALYRGIIRNLDATEAR